MRIGQDDSLNYDAILCEELIDPLLSIRVSSYLLKWVVPRLKAVPIILLNSRGGFFGLAYEKKVLTLMNREKPQIRLKEALLILLMVAVVVGTGVIGLKISPEVPILISIMLIMAWTKLQGFNWADIDHGFIEGIKNGIVPFLIFMLIGALIAVWIASGIIPSLMVFGFHMIDVHWFLPSVCIITTIVGAIIGSGFTIISTLGVAFMGMGITMHINPAMIVGAILCGAIFGDKASPLSATNNLCASVAHANLTAHIKNLMWSTVPALISTVIIFCFIGRGNGNVSLHSVNATVAVLENHFSVTAWAAVPVILLFVCAWGHIPTIAALFINVVVSTVMLLIERPHFGVVNINNMIVSGFKARTGNARIDALLSRGGISSMMSTITLIIVALALGGLLLHLGVIKAIMDPLSKHLHNDASLIIAVVLSGIGVNVFIGEQYLSDILPAIAFRKTFQRHGLAPEALSRAMEDGGTVINWIVPWGVAAAFAAKALGVPVLDYLPFDFFSLLSPVFSILSGITGIGIKSLKDHP